MPFEHDAAECIEDIDLALVWGTIQDDLAREDVADGYVSADAARPEYGLAGVLSQDKSAPTRS